MANTTGMTAPQTPEVDVLAVMGSLNLADPAQRPDLSLARAAVRELIHAAREMADATGVQMSYADRCRCRDNLRVALAAIGARP